MKRFFLLLLMLTFATHSLIAMTSYVGRSTGKQSAMQSAQIAAWLRAQAPRVREQMLTILRAAEVPPDTAPPEAVAQQIRTLRNVKDRALDAKKLNKRAEPLYKNALQDPNVLRAADQAFYEGQLDYLA